MPINPLIALGAQTPDISGTVNDLADTIVQQRENKKLAPLRNQAALTEADLAGIKSNAIVAQQLMPRFEANDMEGAMSDLTARRDQLQKLGVSTRGVDEGIRLLQQDPTGGALRKAADNAIKMVGMFDKSQMPSGLVEFEKKMDIAGLNADERKKAGRVDLGLEPRAQGSAAITTATTEGLTNKVAGSEAVISGAKSGASRNAELDAELQKLPDLKAAVALAESTAKAKGETLTDLNRAKATLPGLEKTISSLKELAPLVTYTYGGKVYDTAAKQLGFGATEGSTARAKFIATVNNQVLPLLRDTFGSAFTAKEGDELKAAMADPDASPEEKLAQLDAFIDQKYKQIQSQERQVGQSNPDDPLGILQ